MFKVRLPVRLALAALACGIAPAGAVIVLNAAPQTARVDDAPGHEQAVERVQHRTTELTGVGIGIAALCIAGLVMRRRTPSRIVSS